MKNDLHPAIQIFYWVLLALLVQHAQGRMLLVGLIILGILASSLCLHQMLGLLRRTRWIFFTLMLIYAYSIPGIAVWPTLAIFSPTIEGVEEGLMQLGRLLCVLAGLSILLQQLSPTKLVSGLYSLALPLSYFGDLRERFAVRLALTLRYAENAMSETAMDWKSALVNTAQLSGSETSHIEIDRQRLYAVDFLLLIIGGAVLIGVLR